MPDNPTDGNQNPAGSAQSPIEPAPQGQGQPLEAVVNSLQSQVETLTKKFEQGIQKENAKANSRLENKINDISSQIGRILELQGKGLSEPEIKRELYLDSLMQRSETPSEPIVGNNQSGQSFDPESVIKSLKFPDNDVSLAKLKQQYANNPQGLIAAAAALRVEQLQTSTPTPATALSQTNGNAGTGLTEDQIAEKAMELEGLYKNYTKNRPAIEALEKELETAGVLRRREA